MIWIKYIQDGLSYQDLYIPSNHSCHANWTGGAVTVGGGYIWEDVYAFAGKHNSIVVGGDDSVRGIYRSCIHVKLTLYRLSELLEATCRAVATALLAMLLV